MSRLIDGLKYYIAANVDGLTPTDDLTDGNVRTDTVDTNFEGLQVVISHGQPRGSMELGRFKFVDISVDVYGGEMAAHDMAALIFDLFRVTPSFDTSLHHIMNTLRGGDVVRRGVFFQDQINYGVDVSMQYYPL